MKYIFSQNNQYKVWERGANLVVTLLLTPPNISTDISLLFFWNGPGAYMLLIPYTYFSIYVIR